MRRHISMLDNIPDVQSSRGKRERDNASAAAVGGRGGHDLSSENSSSVTYSRARSQQQRVLSDRGPLLPGGESSSKKLGGAAADKGSSSSASAILPEDILRSLGLTKLQQDVLFSNNKNNSDGGGMYSSNPQTNAVEHPDVSAKKNATSVSTRHSWSADEDFRLLEEVMTHGPRWTHISRHHDPRRDPQALSQRWSFVESLILQQQQHSSGEVPKSPSHGTTTTTRSGVFSASSAASFSSSSPDPILSKLLPLKAMLESWHLNHHSRKGGSKADTRRVVHAQVMQRVENLTSSSSSGFNSNPISSSGSARSAAHLQGAGTSSNASSSSTSGARLSAASDASFGLSTATFGCTISQGGSSPPASEDGGDLCGVTSTAGSGGSRRGSPSSSCLDHHPHLPDYPESLEDFNHLFPNSGPDAQAAAALTAAMFAQNNSNQTSSNPNHNNNLSGGVEQRLNASLNQESVEGFINSLEEGEFNDPEHSTSTLNVLEQHSASTRHSANYTADREEIEPLLSVLEEVDVGVRMTTTATRGQDPAEATVDAFMAASNRLTHGACPQHWNPEQLQHSVSIAVHNHIETQLPHPPSSSLLPTVGDQQAPPSPPGTIPNTSPTPSELYAVVSSSSSTVASAEGMKPAPAVAPASHSTPFMSAWLNLQSNGLNFNNPVWTSVSEQEPRCMWKSMMPRLIAYLPLPWVYSMGHQFNFLIPSVGAFPLPSTFTMAAAMQHGSSPIRRPPLTVEERDLLRILASRAVQEKRQSPSPQASSSASASSSIDGAIIASIRKEAQEAKMFGASRATSADSPALRADDHTADSRPRVRICPFTIVRSRVQAFWANTATAASSAPIPAF